MNRITNKHVLALLPLHQQMIIARYSVDEFNHVIESITKLVEAVPDRNSEGYDEEGNVTAWLHYFYGGSDWFIKEYDSQYEEYFGYCILNQDTQMAEYGYVAVEELTTDGKVELDFYWDAMNLKEAVNEKYPGQFNITKEEIHETNT